ncbi:restriction endonuclease [Streptomyces sp. NPDC006632]|uniref:restriction endonuclease n=1 Tax=Streptomyces sp. NPDC006632 TaxID=3157182 RepID=UPI0033A8D309
MATVAVGTKIRRSAIHDEHGGNRRKGISRPKSGSYLFLFSNPERGHEYGYYDGWGDDGCYHYSGEGRRGDQQMTGGNRDILEHQQQKRSLELFRSATKGVVTRLGEFALDEEEPHYTTDAPGTDGVLRTVIMFRLRPVDKKAPKPGGTSVPSPASSSKVEDVEVEQHNVEHMAVSSSGTSRQSERREAKLVQAYRHYLQAQGHTVTRKKIVPEGEVQALYTDLYDATDKLLVEAKATVTREAIRMAIGQLFDYRRHLSPRPEIALLLPAKPRPDLLRLCHAAEVAAQVIWPDGDTYVKSRPQGSML